MKKQIHKIGLKTDQVVALSKQATTGVKGGAIPTRTKSYQYCQPTITC
ncbi:class I lanthipeptide [Spirosoma gilvum]